MPRGLIGIGMALAMLLAAVCAASPASAAIPAKPLVGIDGNGVFALPSAEWDGLLAEMAGDGVQVVREDAVWEAVEPSAPTSAGHAYDWTWTDSIAAACARHGLRWLPILGYSTTWSASYATSSGLLQPKHPVLLSPPAAAHVPDYAAFAAAFAARYGPGGAFWTENPSLPAVPVTEVQIWNEPNTPYFWQPSPDAGRYATLYSQARAAILAAAPGVRVAVGALANPAPSFLDELIGDLGGTAQISAVADTPYGQDADGVVGAVLALRGALNAHGLSSVPVEVSEFGWPTQGSVSWVPTMPDSARAVALGQAMRQLVTGGYGVSLIAPYAWVTAERDPTNADDWFGIVHPDGSGTASLTAYEDAARAIESGAIHPPASAVRHRVRKPRHRKAVRHHRRRHTRRHRRRHHARRRPAAVRTA